MTPSNAVLMRSVDYINSNFAAHISMSELCTVSGVSKEHLCTLFRKNLDMRPMEYVAKRRIQAAKELLIGSEKTVETIALETGFCTASYFCKLFKRYEGISPMRFKNAR